MKKIILFFSIAIFTWSNLYAQPSGNYITMNGGSDNVYIPSSSYWNLSGDFTISMNLNFAYTNYWQMLMTHSPGGFELSFTGSQLWLSPTGIGWVLQATWNPQANTWYHLVVTRVGSTIYAYVDGQLIGTGGGSIGVATSPLRLGNYYVGGYSFYGSMDEVSMWNTGATQSSVTTVLANPLTGNEAGLVGYWKLDETGAGAGIAVDNAAQLTGNALDGITQGTATTPYFTSAPEPPTPENSSLCFDGIDDYVTIPSNASLNPGENSSWTIEAWVKLPGNLTPMSIITKRQNYSPYAQITLAKNGPNPYYWEAGKRILFIYQSYQSGFNRRICYTNNDIADGQWHHIAAVADNAANQVKIFVDGIMQPVTTFGDGGWPSISINEPWLMGSSNDPSGLLEGSMQDVRLWKTARSQYQVSQFMYTGIPDPVSETNLVAYYPCNEASGQVLTDHSSYLNNGQLGSVAISDANDPYWCSQTLPDPIQYCLEFDGNDDMVNMGQILNPVFAGADKQFTVEALIYLNASDTYEWILGKYDAWDQRQLGLRLINGKVNFFYCCGLNSSAGVRSVTGTMDLVPGEWYHVAVTYDGTNDYNNGLDRPMIYVNGQWDPPSTTSAAYSLGNIVNGGAPFCIGGGTNQLAPVPNSGYAFDGIIKNVRVWDYLRPIIELQNYMYNPIPDPASQTHLKFYATLSEGSGQIITDLSNSGAIGYLGMDNTASVFDPVWVTCTPPVVQEDVPNCLDFDGIDDYVNVGNKTGFDMNFTMTVEAWIYPEGPGSGGSAGSGGAIVNKEGEFEIARFDNGYIGWAFANYSPGWAWVQTSAYTPLNQWSHVAVVYDISEVRTYLNGILQHSYPVSGILGDVAPTYNDLWISGRQTVPGGQIFDGKMDEVRIWSVARTEAEIRQEMHREIPAPSSAIGLRGNYSFNSAQGFKAYDYSINLYHGTLTNMDELTDWEVSTAPVPYNTITNGSWESNSTWNTGQNPPVNAWSRVQVDHSISLNSVMETIDVTISSEGVLTVNQAKSLTVTGDLVNEKGVSGLVLKSGTTGTATIIENDGAAASVERFFSGNDIDWHLISSPVSNAQSGVFTGKYLQRFDETSNQYIEIVPTNYNLSPMQGYAVYGTSTNNKVTFTGNLNAGSVSIPVTNSATAPYGWNLVGNPFASSVDWNMVIPTLSNIGSTIYYLEASSGNWLTWNGSTGSGSQYIPPMQGFFVSATSNSNLDISNSARTHSGSGTFYKDQVSGLVVIKASGNGFDDKAYIHFSDAATDDFDPQADGYKIISEMNPLLPQIYTTANGKNLSINTLPSCALVPLSFQAGASGTFDLTLVEASDLSQLILEDKKTGTFTDLTKINYIFTYSVSEDPDRFNLHFNAQSVGDNNMERVKIYADKNQVYIRMDGNQDGHVKIFDLTGRTILSESLKNGEINSFEINESSGCYIVNVSSGTTSITEKVFVH